MPVRAAGGGGYPVEVRAGDRYQLGRAPCHHGLTVGLELGLGLGGLTAYKVLTLTPCHHGLTVGLGLGLGLGGLTAYKVLTLTPCHHGLTVGRPADAGRARVFVTRRLWHAPGTGLAVRTRAPSRWHSTQPIRTFWNPSYALGIQFRNYSASLTHAATQRKHTSYYGSVWRRSLHLPP
jgi:hypothetical protein